MANVDYDQSNQAMCGMAQGIGSFGDYAPEPATVYMANCHHCGYRAFLADGDDQRCPVCSGQTGHYMMAFEGPRIHVAALTAAQVQMLRNNRNDHRERRNREIARGQINKVASNQAQWGIGGMGTMEAMQQQINAAAQAQAEQLGMMTQQMAPVWVGNKCTIKTPTPKTPQIGTKEQERAVTHELMDALEYLMKDVLEAAERYPQFEAIARNYAMRRAQAALGHGRAML